MKIAYVLDDIDAAGGIQAVTRAKAGALASLPGNEVVLVAANDPHPGSPPLPPGVRVVHLGINYYEDDWKGFLYVLKGIAIRRRRHARALRRALAEWQPDVVVSVGQAEKFMIPRLSRRQPWKTVREYHYTRTYRRDYARLQGGWRARLIAWVSDFYEYVLRQGRYDSTVVLTQQDRNENWRGRPDVAVIPNPCVRQASGAAPLDRARAVAVGRLVPVKGFDLLIRAWAHVAAQQPGWQLDIWGEGPERARLQALIGELGLTETVFLRGATREIQREMEGASMLVFSSLFEGFGMVLVEAMACGVPCVSFGCPCGPRDIITHGQDGLLVPTGDVRALAEAVLSLIEAPAERRRLGRHARDKARSYSLEAVAGQWMELFQRLAQRADTFQTSI